jgi:hypothetical protein
MREIEDLLIQRWTVEYGDGSEPETVSVPHAWRQDLPLSFEGPVLYRSIIEVPKTPSKLRFRGVSYAATVAIEGEVIATHLGIWDAFDVPLAAYAGSRVEVFVWVIKNGGETFPVGEVASGFLPYVFHTFGGLFGEVSIVDQNKPLNYAAPETRRLHSVESEIYVDGTPFYPRGLLHWGWYPELGHTNVPGDVILKEVQAAQSLGFNLVKFCLWVPPQRYLDILKEEGMFAWMELPIWNPSAAIEAQDRIAHEIESIVRQYRHHDNILLWTIGCELGAAVSAPFRARLTQLVRNLTNSMMVKDSSGSSEMYGGDPREFGDFYDFHPYCDTPFYPGLLDHLLPGARHRQPTLLGEFNDSDVHRDLGRLKKEIPFWASNLSELNEQGVRWQYDLPEVLRSNRLIHVGSRNSHRNLMRSSRQKALFIRKVVHEAVRARDAISGYVVTGWRDTPISSSGFFDDWDDVRFSPEECLSWNGPACLYLIPMRRPHWVNGGNRPEVSDTLNLARGHIHWKVGIHSERDTQGGLIWQVLDSSGKRVGNGSSPLVSATALRSLEIGQIDWHCDIVGDYLLQVEFGQTTNSWQISVTEPFGEDDQDRWTTEDPLDLLGFHSDTGDLVLTTDATHRLRPGLLILTSEGAKPRPFWRESAYEFLDEAFWKAAPFAERWERLLAISPDRVIDEGWLKSLDVPYETLLRRIDVRTYEENAVLVRAGQTFITTLRPFGGLGNQPCGVPNNPAGAAFIRAIGQILSG